MINILTNIISILFGAFLIFACYLAKTISDTMVEEGGGKDRNFNSSYLIKIFITLSITGVLICLYSTYQLYSIFKGV